MKNPISVIIRTSNSEKPLGRLFDRLVKSPDDEFIVVDTRSQDGTLAIAERAGARIIHNTDSFNYARTLNMGFAAAKNDWLLALSAHCVPIGADLLEGYRAAISQVPDETVAFYGFQYWSRQQYDRADQTPRVYGGPHGDPVPVSSNTNALYARRAWLRHPFDETLKTAEDFEWQKWAQREGLLSASAPGGAVYYLHQAGPRYRFGKAWDETVIMGDGVVPMSITEFFLGIAQATRRLLWEARAPRPWVGQIAHQLGTFFASWSTSHRS